ncbi:uncharacterized protein EDB91DRAFT_1050764, partial [Suillus paluster]|uniref:uncharacterized protein n=1 Tax=Suillus paluster TaxID=48578 RepID=UPI001B869F3D
LVPRFHLLTYIVACRTSFSLKLIKGMARMNGEAIGRGWSNMNPVATNTWEMGPGSRCDILDDHFGDQNWFKVSNLGPCFSKKLKKAILECNQHAVDIQNFKEVISSLSLSAWQMMVEEWEGDHSNLNPFKIEASDMFSLI